MIEEKVIVNQGKEYPLDGILTIPESDHLVPAVVLVHGSGPSNKDEKAGKLAPFKDLAMGLAQRGIASLRYDKRTFAHGRKVIKEGDVDVRKETIEDALEATRMLRKDNRIDADRVFIIGHSMGGMLAPRIDAEGGDYAGVIILAGSPRSLDDILVGQLEAIASRQRFLAKWILDRMIKKLKGSFAKIPALSLEEAKKEKMSGGTTLYYFKEMKEHPAKDYLDALQKPVLFLQGEKDGQALIEKDFKEYQKIMEGHANATFKTYPRLNHCFVEALYDDRSKAGKEFSKERHIPNAVMDDIANWIQEIR